MKNITKTFVQREIALDCEGRRWDWEDMNETYEALEEKNLKEGKGGYVGAIREVEKTFNPETFKITIKVIRGREWKFNWDMSKWEFVEMKKD